VHTQPRLWDCHGDDPVDPSTALSLGQQALSLARRGTPALVGRHVLGPAVLLGARQRVGAVVDLGACEAGSVRIVRRCTLGPAAYVRDAVWWTLCLPTANALFADAMPETILNRNVRGFLQGFARAGVAMTYPGRTYLGVAGAPTALLGYDLHADGAVTVDVLAGLDVSIALPRPLAAPDEAAIDRWWGRTPAPLSLGRTGLVGLMEAVAASVAEVAGGTTAPWPNDMLSDPGGRRVFEADDPVPEGMRCLGVGKVPIGRVEAWGDGRRVWLGGDVYGSAPDLDRLATALAAGEGAPRGLHLEGARVADYTALVRRPG